MLPGRNSEEQITGHNEYNMTDALQCSKQHSLSMLASSEWHLHRGTSLTLCETRSSQLRELLDRARFLATRHADVCRHVPQHHTLELLERNVARLAASCRDHSVQ